MTEVHKVCTTVTAFYHIYGRCGLFLWVFSMANLKLKDNLKLYSVDINGL